MKTRKKIRKKLLGWRVGQARKKGAILIEFIVAIPVFFLMIWGIMNMMLYLLASSQLNEAAYEASRALAVEMRGIEGNIQNAHMMNVENNINLVVNQSNFVQFNKEGHEAIFVADKTSCDSEYDKNRKNIFCAYVETYQAGNGKTFEQIVVKMKSDFYIIGNFIPGLSNVVSLNARAVAQKELPGRANYAN